MKINKTKTKGFTLIELMVVIAIITLLSSVVLAALSTAREKARVTKTVAEMKSLQTAIAQYQLDNGSVPYEQFSINSGGTSFNDSYGGTSLTTLLNMLITPKKYISKIPNAPGFPSNTNKSVLGYMTYSGRYTIPAYNWAYYCGEKPVNKYMIYFHPDGVKLNLPTAYYKYNYDPAMYDAVTSAYVNDGSAAYENRTYCVSD